MKIILIWLGASLVFTAGLWICRRKDEVLEDNSDYDTGPREDAQ